MSVAQITQQEVCVLGVARSELAEMAGWGHDDAIGAIQKTIGNGWQSIYPPKSFSSKPRAEGALKLKEVPRKNRLRCGN